MPVSDQTPVNSYTGNAIATTFAYTFKIFANSDIKVTVGGVLKVLTTDYSITGAGQSGGGNVVFVTAPADGAAIVIYRDITFSRSTDYVDGGDLMAGTIDDDFDRVVMLMQQLKDDKNRALKLVKGETADQAINETAANRANKVVGFDAAGALALKAIADLGEAYSIGRGLQVVASDLRVAEDQTFQGRINVAFSVGGTVDAITAVYSPIFTAWVDKMRGTFRASGANATTTPTFAPDGLAAKTFVKENLAALLAGDIAGAGHEVEWIYNATADKVILLNPKGGEAYSIGRGLQVVASDLRVAEDQTFQGRINVAFSVGGTVDAITAVHAPTFTAWVDKMRGTFRAAGANATTTPTFDPDGLAAKTFVKENLIALAVGDIAGAGHEVEWIYNATADKVILLNPKATFTLWNYEAETGTLSLGTLYTLAHGLGAKPTLVHVRLRCVSVDVGWQVGDELAFAIYGDSTWTSHQGVGMDATNIYVWVNATVLAGFNKAGGGANLTSVNWKALVKARK